MDRQLKEVLSSSDRDLEGQRQQQRLLRPMLDALHRRASGASTAITQDRLIEGYLQFVGSCHKSVGADLTCEALMAARRLKSGSLELRSQLMGALEERNQLDEADEICLQNQSGFSKSGNPNVLLNLARMHRRMKRYDEAIEILEPLRFRVLPELQEAEVRFQYAANLHHLGEYSAAFKFYEKANCLVAQSHKASRYAVEAESILRRISDEISWRVEGGLFPKPPALRDGLPQPIFLVGFPRSGTTLLEHVLAGHPDLSTLSERPLLAPLLTPFYGPAEQVSQRLSRLTNEEVAAFRAAYWQRLRFFQGEERTDGSRVVDKLPLNINNLALIHFFFPEAKVIMTLRDPRDVLLSNFMQHFALNSVMWFSFELSRLLIFYQAVMALYLKNRQEWGHNNLQEVQYEELVANGEEVSSRLSGFLDVPRQRTMLDHIRAARNKRIYTPSYHQVAEPLHGKAIGRWENYEPYMAEYFLQLKPVSAL